MKKTLFGLIISVLLLVGCSNDNNQNGNSIGKYNGSFESLMKGVCTILEGKETSGNVVLSLYATELHSLVLGDSTITEFENQLKSQVLTETICNYKITKSYTSAELIELEKWYLEKYQVSHDFKECKTVYVNNNSGDTACKVEDGKWYMFGEKMS